MKRVFLWVGVACALGSSPAAAQFYQHCMEPVEPFCVSSTSDFSDERIFTSCLHEVEDFISGVEYYRERLLTNDDEAVDHANRVIDRFNCRAQGRSFCP